MHAVIMAGGRGARFWPRSRERKPKHLLDIASSRTIIQETVDRIGPLIQPENIIVVTGRRHARELIRQLPQLPVENVIIEPVGRNTAACIGLAALHIQKKCSDDVMVVLPSDHAIGNPEQFLNIVGAAAQRAAAENALVTVGIKPTSPHTGYGYIESGAFAGQTADVDVFHVKSIREKPDMQLAQTFVNSGRFYWNSGMFIWRASTILMKIERHLPDLHSGLMKIKKALGLPAEAKTVNKIYRQLKSISIDYGVMEKADRVLVLPGAFGWSDVGSWDTLWEILPKDNRGNAVAQAAALLAEDASDSLIYSPRKLVALVGVKDLIVVDTKDALLICRRGQSQQVKEVVDALERERQKKYL